MTASHSPAEAYARFRRDRSSPHLRTFADGYGFAFDDYQIDACRQVEAGSGVLVAAPTGAGKTIVGEFAVFLALAQGRKCFYTTPIKALSNQKYADLVRRHGTVQVGLLTGDTSINSEAPVVVMTTEVLRNMIYAGSSTLGNLGFVVMDEVHYLADRFRGAVWEEVIIGLADSIQVVALSATVSNAEEFGDWLSQVRGEMAVVVSERRPVPLFQHVLIGHRLYDLFADVAPTARQDPGGRSDVNAALIKIAREESRFVRDDSRRPRGRAGRGRRTVSYGSGAYGGAAHRPREEGVRRPRSLSTPSRAQIVELLDSEALLPAIVFIFSRIGCDAAVRQLLSSGIELTDIDEQREISSLLVRHVGGLSDTDLRALDYDRFSEALSRGISAHHAGMLPAFKECVEEAFVRGLVKVVFATETLALGINMPARSVVLWQPGLDPRAVAGLASRRTYPLTSSFAPTYNMAVNLVASVGRDRARVLLEQSFAQFQSAGSIVGIARAAAKNTKAIEDAWREAACDRGDFVAYARLRGRVAELETTAARERRADRRAESLQSLLHLKPGDILRVPSGRRSGWAIVIDPGTRAETETPRPLVMTEDRHVRRLSIADFPTPPAVAGRMKIGKHFNSKEAASRRNLGAAFRSKLAEIDRDAAGT